MPTGPHPPEPDGRRDAFAVPEALDGERLDRVVALLAGVSRSDATRWIAAGEVHVGGAVERRPARRVAGGTRLALPDAPAGPDAPGPDPSVAVVVVHEDPDVIVVDKPAGLVVHPGAGQPAGTLVNGLLARYPELAGVGAPDRPGIVHRLDEGTSGLLVVARSPRAHASLSAQAAEHTMERTYTAVVRGVVRADAGVVDAPLGRDPRQARRLAVVAGGRPARTHYAVDLRCAPLDATALTCTLETGRTHQIRVHLAAIGHPVVGDTRYGGDHPLLAAPRPMLHARRLSFAHPAGGEPVAFEAAPPEDLRTVLAALDSATGRGAEAPSG